MKTELEKYLRDHREDLDAEVVPTGAWEKIRKDFNDLHIDKPKKFQWWKVAAVVFLATSIGLTLNNFSLQEKVNELASLGDISEEYLEVENSYKQEISQLTSQFSLEEVLSSQDFEWLAAELETVENINDQYRRDIGTDADQDLIVEALIDYYEKKIRLLRKLELEINRQQNEKRNTDNYSAS